MARPSWRGHGVPLGEFDEPQLRGCLESGAGLDSQGRWLTPDGKGDHITNIPLTRHFGEYLANIPSNPTKISLNSH